MPEFTGHRDIRSYIRTIWRWKLLIVILVVGAPVVAYLLEHGKPKNYRSSTLVAFTQPATSSNFTLPTTNSVFQTGNVNSIAKLVTTQPIATIAGQLMKPPVDGSTIVGNVSASADTTTDFITITANANSPTEAADIANAFAKALNVNENSETHNAIEAAITNYKGELSRMTPTNPNYQSLQQQLLAAETAEKTAANGISQLQPAEPDDTATGPHPKRAAELGLVIGILLAFGAVMLLDSVDRRLRSPDELEEFTKLPLLAAIAPTAFDGDLETTPVDAEAFQTLRTSLTYFTIDKKVKSVLVASPGEQEGKSTVAVRLALACANAGLDVVLVDADLRRGGSTAKLGLQPKVGLGLVLAEQRPVETALVDWSLGPDDTGRLRVLAAGSPPPNPAALISSQQMRDLIRTLEDQADLVIIDTPAALAVSDAVPMMQNVSGIVLVARMNRSSRDTVRRLQKIIVSAHGRLLGTVATGVTAGPGYEKYSQAYYSPAGERHNGRRGRRRAKQAARDRDSDRGVQLAQPQESPQTQLD
ncbi:MAG TPA: polysaccharide biosynthesis tyrosine autokinase [Solirubrobacteraceae bacterium]|jgi:capsular exopolysaccharide synthesis family protein|nr:polysaccharide biosynthesis tyrosine autokinase [Solirubrobacteraceae bacterium]